MTTYTIQNRASGLDLGQYDGATEDEALDAMARDAGYAGYAEACEATGEQRADLIVKEISPMITMTKAEFDALRPLNADRIREERDGAYLYEIIVDDAGNEIAFASRRNGECEGYTRARAPE